MWKGQQCRTQPDRSPRSSLMLACGIGFAVLEQHVQTIEEHPSIHSQKKKKSILLSDVHELGSLEDDKVVYNVLHVHSTLRRVCLGGLIVFFF